MTVPQGPNQCWSLDFLSDAFACGRRFRIFAVVDDYSRECVRLIADTSISGARVGRELDAGVFERMARPHTIFTSLAHARQELEAWRHDYNHFRPHSSLGNPAPAEIGAGSTGKPYRGHAPNAVVAITPSDGHQNDPRLYW